MDYGGTLELSTKHREGTALDLKNISNKYHIVFLYVNHKLKIFHLNCTEMIFVRPIRLKSAESE
jgi:hypothetical protein